MFNAGRTTDTICQASYNRPDNSQPPFGFSAGLSTEVHRGRRRQPGGNFNSLTNTDFAYLAGQDNSSYDSLAGQMPYCRVSYDRNRIRDDGCHVEMTDIRSLTATNMLPGSRHKSPSKRPSTSRVPSQDPAYVKKNSGVTHLPPIEVFLSSPANLSLDSFQVPGIQRTHSSCSCSVQSGRNITLETGNV